MPSVLPQPKAHSYKCLRQTDSPLIDNPMDKKSANVISLLVTDFIHTINKTEMIVSSNTHHWRCLRQIFC